MKRNDEIVIYTTQKELKKKQSKLYSLTFWDFTRAPISFPRIRRIYFATDGRVWGSFQISGHGIKGSKKRLYWKPRSWRRCKYTVVVKAFRGFRYRWW